MNIAALINEGAQIKANMDAMKNRLDEINAVLAEAADFSKSNTAHLVGDGVKATLTRKINTRWDQPGLNALRLEMGDGAFFDVFAWKFEPTGKKNLDAALKYSPHANQIKACMTTTPGKPSVKYENVEA